jgi:hypothetical protein
MKHFRLNLDKFHRQEYDDADNVSSIYGYHARDNFRTTIKCTLCTLLCLQTKFNYKYQYHENFGTSQRLKAVTISFVYF